MLRQEGGKFMIVVFAVQVLVCVLILRWLLKQKTGEPFSKKMVAKLLGFGALSVVVFYAITFALPIRKDTFFGLNPFLAGFVTALITAALAEEVVKYIFFRLALIKNGEVVCWLDAIIAAVMVGMGFTLMEDLVFALTGDSNVLRAVLPAHLLFQAIMGYFYGKARVTGNRINDVLSLAGPILAHTFFDMFIIGLIAVIGDKKSELSGMSMEELSSLPNSEYIMPLFIGLVVSVSIVFVAMILMLRQIGVWSKNGEKQESLNGEV